MSLMEDFYRQNEWSNLRLLEVLRTLTPEQLGAAAPGTYGSIRMTLLHLILAEYQYVLRLGGTYEGPRFSPEAGYPSFDDFEAATRGATVGLIERAHAATAAPYVVRETEGDESADVDAELLLVQAVNHGADHRSHICTVLTTLGIEPPEIDAWGWGRNSGRFREL